MVAREPRVIQKCKLCDIGVLPFCDDDLFGEGTFLKTSSDVSRADGPAINILISDLHLGPLLSAICHAKFRVP